MENNIEIMNKFIYKRSIGPFASNLFNKPEPVWKATSILQLDSQIEGGPMGVIDFKPIGPYHFIRITINGSGFPAGKHAVHIHIFGDVTESCKRTGPHMLNNFIGNVEARDDGVISSTFASSFVNIFGVYGILGRSVVIHEKPIEINRTILSYFISPSTQNEEKEVGEALACGSIIFTNNLIL